MEYYQTGKPIYNYTKYHHITIIVDVPSYVINGMQIN
jgi:hypothetical protein